MGNFKIHLFSEIIYTLVYLFEIKRQLWDKKASNLACVALFYVCGSSSRNWLKLGNPFKLQGFFFIATKWSIHNNLIGAASS